LREDKTTKSNHISKDYFVENMEKDYSRSFNSFRANIFHVHGEKDDKVPLESLNISFRNFIPVKEGDHDLEKPDMRAQWIDGCISFILKG